MAMLEGKLDKLETQPAEMRRFHRELSGYRVRCAEALEEGADCPLIVDVSRPEKARLTPALLAVATAAVLGFGGLTSTPSSSLNARGGSDE